MNNNPGTLYKILNGINNTLNIANKALPIVEQAKPIFNTVTKTYKTIKNNGKDIPQFIKLLKLKNEIKNDMNNNIETISYNNKNSSLLDKYPNTNNPKFFI